jgi:peptidoglycan hydrolase FlgJ
MELPSLRSAASSFGPSDLVRSKAEQTLGKLEASPEFKLDLEATDKGQAMNLTDPPSKPEGEDLRKAFQDFVGQTLFSQMISSMRSTQDGAAYFNGGRAEKIFQGQLDQILSEELSEASASKISDPMFKLFQLRRQ